MKNLHWHSIIANYMVISKDRFVSIQTIQRLYEYIEYRLISKDMDSEFPKLNNQKKKYLIK